MPTKTQTPEALHEQAEKLRQQAAEVQAEIDAQSMREYEREQEERRTADQTLVDNFDAAALDSNVTAAHEHLRHVITESPIVQAHAAYLAAQWLRNHAHADITGARGRLGLPTTGARLAGTTDVDVQELIDTTAQREAQRQVDTYRTERA